MSHWKCDTRCTALKLLLNAEEDISEGENTRYHIISTRVFDCIANAILRVPQLQRALFAPELLWILRVREMSIRQLESHDIRMANEFWNLVDNLLHHAVITRPFDYTSKPQMHMLTIPAARGWRTIARGYNLASSLGHEGLGTQFVSLESPQIRNSTTLQHRVFSTPTEQVVANPLQQLLSPLTLPTYNHYAPQGSKLMAAHSGVEIGALLLSRE